MTEMVLVGPATRRDSDHEVQKIKLARVTCNGSAKEC